MDKAIVKYRTLFAIAFIGLIVALSVAGFHLAGWSRWLSWGVATGVLWVLVSTAVNWTSFDRRTQPIIMAVVLSYPTFVVYHALPGPELWPFVGGFASGFALTLYFVPVGHLPPRMPPRPAPKAPLEEASSHTLVVSRDKKPR